MSAMEIARLIDSAVDAYRTGTWIIGMQLNKLLQANEFAPIELEEPAALQPMWRVRQDLQMLLPLIHKLVPGMDDLATKALWRVGPFQVGFDDDYGRYFDLLGSAKFNGAELTQIFNDCVVYHLQIFRGYRSQLDLKLNKTESEVMEAVGCECLKAEEIAKKLETNLNSTFKTTLSGLVKRGFLRQNHPGYCNPYQYKPTKSPQSPD